MLIEPIEIKSKHVLHEQDMLMLGAAIGLGLQPNLIIYLWGDLGAGKTTLTRGMLRGLGFHDKVKSPTYTIVEPYHINELDIYHFDLYRITHPSECDDMGMRDYFTANTICIVEWPQNAKGNLPQSDIDCRIEFLQDARTVTLIANTELGKAVLQKL